MIIFDISNLYKGLKIINYQLVHFILGVIGNVCNGLIMNGYSEE